MNKLIIFADYGLDDAAATASILQRQERFDAIDIVAIGGNVPPEVSLRNCYTLISCFPEALEKITVVDTTDMPQPSEYLAEIHGKVNCNLTLATSGFTDEDEILLVFQ